MGGKSDGLSKREERGVEKKGVSSNLWISAAAVVQPNRNYITLSKWIEEPPTVSTYLGRKRTFA